MQILAQGSSQTSAQGSPHFALQGCPQKSCLSHGWGHTSCEWAAPQGAEQAWSQAENLCLHCLVHGCLVWQCTFTTWPQGPRMSSRWVHCNESRCVEACSQLTFRSWPQPNITATLVRQTMTRKFPRSCTLWQSSTCLWPQGNVTSTCSMHAVGHVSPGVSVGESQSPQRWEHLCAQPSGRARLHGCLHFTSRCSRSNGWQRRGHRWPQRGSKELHFFAQPPCIAFSSKSPAVVTRPPSAGWWWQRRFKAPMQPFASNFSKTLNQLSFLRNMDAFPKMYMPCRARDKATMMRFSIAQKPNLLWVLLRTKDRMTTSFSSPW
mmetsp:Transcript_79120/g.229819  ORF Transcript_79120/g.229819 Transcript_79120/m.229819 type:complete len:320 (-) Transcript_79120:3514-4473(-)